MITNEQLITYCHFVASNRTLSTSLMVLCLSGLLAIIYSRCVHLVELSDEAGAKGGRWLSFARMVSEPLRPGPSGARRRKVDGDIPR